MATLEKRPLKFDKSEDIAEPENMEKVMLHIDKQLSTLDNRRIVQVAGLEDTATASEVLAKLNELIALLNSSDLTEE